MLKAKATAQPSLHDAVRRGHEPTELKRKPVIIFLAIFLIAGVVIHLIVWWLMVGLMAQRPAVEVSPVAGTRAPAAAPPLQGTPIHRNLPYQDRQAFWQRERQILDSHGWVDRERGLARIPIERAMDLALEQGLFATEAESAPPSAMQKQPTAGRPRAGQATGDKVTR